MVAEPTSNPPRNRPFSLLPLGLLLLLLAALGACEGGSPEGEALPNQAPRIFLSSGPLHGDPDTSYRVHFYWNGFDPDGRISHFQYLVTHDEATGSLLIDENIYDTLEGLGYEWSDVHAHDSTFIVSADSIPRPEDNPADSLYVYGDRFLFRAQHTFFIRAVDEEGLHSELPKHRSFTATTIAPTVKIVFPSDLGGVGGYDGMPPDIFFRWTGNDSVGDGTIIEPDSTRYALLRRGDLGLDQQSQGSILSFPDSTWTIWRGWDDVDSLNTEVGGKKALVEGLTPTSSGAGQGYYLFLVQAKDEAGAITSHFVDGQNLRKLRVVSSLQPIMVVREHSLGTNFTRNDQIYDYSVAEDQPLQLSWRASAAEYGSEITGYRFGWDILDPSNDEEWSSWSLSNTSSSASFPGGTHSFYVEARDFSGTMIRVIYRFVVVPFTMTSELLFVDDYDNSRVSDPLQGWPNGPDFTWGTLPHDQGAHMAWWWELLQGYTGYIAPRDYFRVNVVDKKPYIEILGQYRRVIWEVRESDPWESGLSRVCGFVDPYTEPPTLPYDYLGAFMDRGGQALICGTFPVFSLLPTPGLMGDNSYERKSPVALLKHLGYSQGDVNESTAAIQQFLPWRHFGIDTAVKPVDPNPRDFYGGNSDLKTTRTFWGMVGAGYPGGELSEFPISTGWAPGDTLFFSPEVYEWLADAAPIFNNPDDWDSEMGDFNFFGLADAEIYNWDRFKRAFNPPLNYRPDAFRPLLTYIPADSTTRWGQAPTAAHPFWRPEGLHYDELGYSEGGGHQLLGVVGMRNPDAPSVLIGMVPYYLEQETAQGLIDHILIDIFGMERY
jgi:hypothetical protein